MRGIARIYFSAWEAVVLPLNYARETPYFIGLSATNFRKRV
jgi:hypothetical protein